VQPNEFASVDAAGNVFAVWRDVKGIQDRRLAQHQTVRAPLIILRRLYTLKWHVALGAYKDKTYALQPGRGVKAVGRFRILAICREWVKDISFADCRAEGIEPAPLIKHVDAATIRETAKMMERYAFARLWDSIHTKPGTRFVNNPQVWALTIRVDSGE